MNTIARHLIAEFYQCSPERLNDEGVVQQCMHAAAEIIGATIVGEVFHEFSPQGVSGTVVIAESHLSIHTWPESGYAAVDIFTCGGLNPRRGFELIGEALGAASTRVQEIIRGLPEEIAENRALVPSDVQIMGEVVTLEPMTRSPHRLS